ncbi:MAG: chemotaxis protein CheA [Gemmatimonadota bacterium]|nr:chemotaxis protein CheA [Gemmatimonadota bacterium]
MSDPFRPSVDLSQFTGVFLEEAREHHEALEAGLLRLERGDRDPDLLNTIFRAAHSIKGASGTFGFRAIMQFTHALETALDRVRGGTLAVSPEFTADLFRAVDVLNRLIDAASNGDTELTTDEVMLAQALERAGAGQPIATPIIAVTDTAPAGPRRWQLALAPSADLFRCGSDPLLLLRDLGDLGELSNVVVNATAVPALETLDPESCFLTWSVELLTEAPEAEIRGTFLFVEDSCSIEVTALDAPVLILDEAAAPVAQSADVPTEATTATARAATARADTARADTARADTARADTARADTARADAPRARTTESATIRVATEKVDALVNLVGELIIGQAMVASVIDRFTPDRMEDLREAASALDRHLRDLQERVLAIRMLPIGSLFSRFERVVRDVGAATGKKVQLVSVGEDTELDKSVIEGLADPLTHLLRNAVDHGIETTETRIARGKPETGTVTLAAQHEAGSVLVEISDDGGGLNLDRIRAKGESLGLLRPNEPVSDEQIRALIFAPGFSTASAVSDLSGRGVGMDVVRRNVESLNGSISIDSRPGAGTTFRIRLPLTLAILDGMQLQLGSQVYVLPLLSIVESFRLTPEVHRPVLGRGEVVLVRGATLPLVRLSAIVGQPAGREDGIVVVVEHGGRQVGLLVDDLLGEQQVVVKNLEAHYRRVEGILGATILGDGHVALILDTDALIRIGTASTTELAA